MCACTDGLTLTHFSQDLDDGDNNYKNIFVNDFLQMCFQFYLVNFIDDPSAFGLDNGLTRKQLETHGCVHSTVATDALVLKQQAVSIHSVD